MLGLAGSELHALLFKTIEEADVDYAATLHSYDIKPFTLGPLNGDASRQKSHLVVEEGKKYSFTLAALNEEMVCMLPKISDHLSVNDFRLGGATFRLEEARLVFTKPLPYFMLMSGTVVKDQLTISFKSPTCFRRDGQLNLFPLPGLVLSGLINRWTRFSEVPLPIFNTESLIVSRYGLKTGMVRFDKYNLVGFMGFCKYSFLPEARDIDKWALSVLFSFANLAGVGYKTAMGMGQVHTT
jgi:CRISPR-associated endoribonuclease Cas6